MSQERDEADLVLRFYDLRREARLREARSFFLHRFKAASVSELDELCPSGSEENASFRQVVSYWDMVAAIVERRFQDKELFFETNSEITVVWEKVKHLVPALREASKNPRFLANLEAIAEERAAYVERECPGYLEALRERLGV